MFADGLGYRGLIPGRVILKIQKMVLDASLHNTQHYRVRIKGKIEQYREKSNALSVAIEKGAFGLSPTRVANLYIYIYIYIYII